MLSLATYKKVLRGDVRVRCSHEVCDLCWMGNGFIFSILAASGSYMAVRAAMRLAAPKADPWLYITMALGVTFPFNITVGMPLYFAIVNYF